MDNNTTPKISFIPKGSLIREETFLERPRPRSAIGIVAVFVFIISVGSFAGLYFYDNSLNDQVATKLDQIQNIQKVFEDSPQVDKAKNFRSRAEIIQGLLDGHTVVSPLLDFLSANTLTSIMYNKFSFTKENGVFTVELNGEAPSYAALAYQREVFKGKTTELLSSTISNVSLTPFGTVSFSLALVFNPSYLSYVKNINAALPGTSATTSQPLTLATSGASQETNVTVPVVAGSVPIFVASTSTDMAGAVSPTSSASSSVNGVGGYGSTTVGTSTDGSALPLAPVSSASAPVQKPSFWSSFWSWFKFW